MASSERWQKRQESAEKGVLTFAAATIASSLLFGTGASYAAPVVGSGAAAMGISMICGSHAQKKRFEESDAEREADKILKEAGL